MEKRARIQSIDALRGLCILLMVAYHFFYDLVYFLGAPSWIFGNPVFDVLQPFVAGIFITLAGVSSRFSRSNVKRGIKCLIVALAVTAVTLLMGSPVYFGILHFMGVAMILYGLTEKIWDKIPRRTALVLYLALTVATGVLRGVLNPIRQDGLWIFGFYTQSFSSSDYFPILPWIFVFLFGTWLGVLIREEKLPKKFYTINPPFFPAVGRHTLLIYVLHQPVLYGVTLLLQQIF